MIDGLGHDDRYRMVEDEFAQTARTLTVHLHAAEYQRLKDATKSQNAETNYLEHLLACDQRCDGPCEAA